MTADRSQIFVIDRGCGRHRFLSSLVPDAVHLKLGTRADAGAAINPWDVPDAGAVPESKIAFLMRIHALLVGEHEHGTHPLGLSALEHNLLDIAVRDVYARAARGDAAPSESLLRAVLDDLARREQADPHAATYADLIVRLRDLCAGGRFGHVLDRPTCTDVAHAPLVVFELARVPDEVVAAVLLSVVEFVTARAARAPAGRISLLADVIDLPPGGDDEPLPAAFPRESLLNGLHDSYMRRRMLAGETRPIAYLHAISDVAHFLHPPTALSPGRHAHDVWPDTTRGGS